MEEKTLIEKWKKKEYKLLAMKSGWMNIPPTHIIWEGIEADLRKVIDELQNDKDTGMICAGVLEYLKQKIGLDDVSKDTSELKNGDEKE